MTSDDIIRAAFKVWGRKLYRTTSLTEITRELGVSKPALYRHFKDKDALLEAMYTKYFDDCASFIKNGCDRAVQAPSRKEAYLIIVRTIAEYYVRNMEVFIFSLFRVYDSRDKDTVSKEFSERGINFEQPGQEVTASYPPTMQLVMATLVFCVAEFHRRRSKSGGKPRFQWASAENHGEAPSNEAVSRILAQIEDRIKNGLGLDAGKIDALNYESLEQRAAGMEYEDTENNTLLKAVAEAVAEGGPWNTSMEMVARRSGLSKSGLYAHFKNKQDMLGQLFITEFNRMANFAKAQIETTEVHEEQLYLAIISIVYYLRARPEILVTIDQIKTRQLEVGKEVPVRLFRIIKSIKLEAVQNYDTRILVDFAQWILFMVVNTLAWRPLNPEEDPACRNKDWAKNIAEVPNESFRFLFRFIALGLEDLNL